MNLDFLMDSNGPKEGYTVIDLSQIALATVMAVTDPGEKLTIKNVRAMILNTLKKNALRFKTEGFTKTIITIDNAKYGYWRRQFRDYYKRNRTLAREDENNTFDWDGYFEALSIVIDELKNYMPYIVLDVRHAEADDCIAVITQYLTSLGHKVRIISSDGDFSQLHKYPNVDQWSPMQKKWVKVKSDSPEEDCLIKIIKGDRKDNVSSIKVRGNFYLTMNEGDRTPPTSSKLIKSLVGKSDSEVEQVLYDEIKKKKDDFHKETLLVHYGRTEDEIKDIQDLPRFIADLQMERFKENRVLIDFDYIRDDIKEAIMKEFHSYKPAPRGKMYSYFVKNGLKDLIKDLNMF